VTKGAAYAGIEPRHARYFRERGIAPDVVKERGYKSITSPVDFPWAKMNGYNFVTGPQFGAGIYIPRHGVDRKPIAPQFRPDKPRIKDGKPVKYESPIASGAAIDVPPRSLSGLKDPAVPLIITESAAKADAAVSKKLCAISINGVQGWKSKGSPLQDFREIAFTDRDVFIAFDSDVATNPDVRRSAEKLRDLLTNRGARAKIIVLPPGPKGEKVGLDDFLAKNAAKDLLALVAPARPEDEEDESDWVPSTLEGVVDEHAGAVEWIARDFIQRGGTVVISAEYKTAKSLTLYRAAIDLALGRHVLGRFVVAAPQRVVVFQLEMPAREDDRRFRRLAKGAGVDPAEIVRLAKEGKLVVYNRVPLDLMSPKGVDRFHAAVRRHDAEVVIVDSALAACSRSDSGDDPMNSNSGIRQMFTRAFLPLTSEGRSIVVLTHRRKSGNGKRDDARGAMLGAQAWGAAADQIFSIERLPARAGDERRSDHAFACRLSVVGAWTPESMRDVIVRVRDTEDGGTVVEALDFAGDVAAGGVTKKGRAHVALEELIGREPKIGQAEALARVAKDLKLSPKTVRTALDGLIRSDKVRQEDHPNRKNNAKCLVLGVGGNF